MQTLTVIETVLMASTLGALVFGVILVSKMLKEMREAGNETRIGRKAILESHSRVEKTFLDAQDSFRRLVDGLQDLNNLQQIKLLTDQVLQGVVDAHQKIGSQVDATGRLVDALNEHVKLWSNEGTQLQAAYTKLAEAVEQALARDAEARQRLNMQVGQLLQTHAAEGKPNAAK